jgi:hypothetical protein
LGSAPSKKKRYVYTREKKQELRAKGYQTLHEIDSFLRSDEKTYPGHLTTSAKRRDFRKKVKQYTPIEDQLHKFRAHQPCRVLWENEILPTLKEIHERWAHYPKDQGKFRAKVDNRFFFPQLIEITRHFILTCEVCQNEKAGRAGRTDREIHPASPVSPFLRVHVDLTGPFTDNRTKIV